MQRSVKESVQAEHAAEAQQIRQPKKSPQRRHGKREDDKTDGPIAGEVRYVLNRVSGKILLPGPPGNPCQRSKTQQEQRGFDPAVAQHG